VSFAVAAQAYDDFMGRFSGPLAIPFADLLELRAGQRVLDVGCGPGALTRELVDRTGAANVAAIDPMTAFTDAVRERCPGVDVRVGPAEDLPFADDAFDAAAAQLVVHFMADPVAGLREMGRVTRPGGAVAACVWDYGTGGAPLAVFWRAVRDLDPGAPGEEALAGAREGDLVALFDEAGLVEVRGGTVSTVVDFESFEDWWRPYNHGVGPAGAYVATLSDSARGELVGRCAELLGDPPFAVTATAWSAVGRAPACAGAR
jgi:SAM-dependent methyltransferase